MATGGLDYSMFLERSILCSKEYITDEHITLPHGERYWLQGIVEIRFVILRYSELKSE